MREALRNKENKNSLSKTNTQIVSQNIVFSCNLYPLLKVWNITGLSIPPNSTYYTSIPVIPWLIQETTLFHFQSFNTVLQVYHLNPGFPLSSASWQSNMGIARKSNKWWTSQMCFHNYKHKLLWEVKDIKFWLREESKTDTHKRFKIIKAITVKKEWS